MGIIIVGIIYQLRESEILAQLAPLEKALSEAKAQQQKAEDAIQLLAELGPVRATATPPPKPGDDDEFILEAKKEWDLRVRRHRKKRKRAPWNHDLDDDE